MKMKKPTALLLACLMLLTALAGCAAGGQGETDSKSETEQKEQGTVTDSATESETETEFFPEIEQADYNTDLYMECYQGDGIYKYIYAEEGLGDVLTEALYNRQVKLQDYLGVNLIIKPGEGGNAGYTNAFTTSVKNKDGAIDLFFCQAYVGVVLLVQGGYVQDLNEIAELNLDAEYWNEPYMDSISIHGKYYLGYGDFCIANTHVITYNKTMMAQYADAMTETVYDSVRNYRWTLDRMISLAGLVYTDATGDGKSEDDTYGMSGQQWIPFIGFYHASGIPLVEQNEKGEYKVAVYNEVNKERTASLVQKLKDFAGSDAAWFRYQVDATPVITMDTNRALMVLYSTKNLDSLLPSGVEFGVLPYPMFDEAQKDIGYRHLNYDGYLTFPSYSRDVSMVAQSLELLNYWGGDVTVAVYEKLLGKQVADTPDDAQMLEIVWDTICTDIGLTYCSLSGSLDSLLYSLPTLTNPVGTAQVASYLEQHARGSEKALEKFVGKMGKQ